MSADEDTELRDLVAQTLEVNGVLGKIRAQLRASVFLALEEQESVQNKAPFLSQDLKRFLATNEGRVVAGLVREFLEHFGLEFTQAVFEPESGFGSNYEGRSGLARELNLPETDGAPKSPLLMELLQRSNEAKVAAGRPTGIERDSITGTGSRPALPQDLTSKQLADARSKFEYYDKDNNDEIDRDELRDLFMDMFPNFNRNMLDRYVNDEFRAADRDISNRYLSITAKGISFQEFVAMYKRLFLQCRSVVAGDVASILSPTSPNKSLSSTFSKASISEKNHIDVRNQRNLENSLENGPKQTQQDSNTDTEEDFFDEALPTTPTGYRAFGSKDTSSSPTDFNSKRGTSPGRPSQIPVYSALRSDERPPPEKPMVNSTGNQKSMVTQGRGPSSGGMTSLQGLPSLTGERNTTRKSRQLPVFKGGSPRSQHSVGNISSTISYSAPVGDTSDTLRAMDKRMAELGLDGDAQDYSYEDDFQSEGHSISQKSQPLRSEVRSQNGSLAEEIEEDIDDLSIEGDDLLRSEKSAFDDMTTDRTISQHESGFDYIEDLQSP